MFTMLSGACCEQYSVFLSFLHKPQSSVRVIHYVGEEKDMAMKNMFHDTVLQ